MVASMVVGCSGGADGSSTAAATTTDSTSTTTTATTDDTASSESGENMVIEFYDVAANYQGMQTGWFDKVIKDRFNIDLNIIAPQVAGDAIYQTRCADGNLGDIILLDPAEFKDCVAAGLIKDISADFDSCTNLKDYEDQISTFNKGIEGIADGAIYGIPVEMTNTSPTSVTDENIYSSPLLRWDLYSELGCPDIADLEGLLDVLEQMMQNHPTNADGDPAYPFSLWPDWDGGDGMLGIANVVQLTTWYGEKIKGSAILKPDNTMISLTDKNGSYYKILQFLNHAYLRGLVDPDSATQDWNAACAKMSAGQVYLMWYSWQVGFWNTQERLDNGTAFTFVPVADQVYYADSDSYYGSGRVIGIGSGVDDEKYQTILKFLDWYASPEALEFQHAGIEGFNYTRGADGKFTAMNDNALMDNLPVPEEYGGGGYSDGNNAINQWIVAALSTNPNTGEGYAMKFWSSYKEATKTQMKAEWEAKFGASDPVSYMKANNVLLVSPNVSVSLPSDTNDILVIRNQCNEELCDASWRMIFASDDAEFDAMWDEMAATLDGYGFQDLLQFDMEKEEIEIAAKSAAK